MGSRTLTIADTAVTEAVMKMMAGPLIQSGTYSGGSSDGKLASKTTMLLPAAVMHCDKFTILSAFRRGQRK